MRTKNWGISELRIEEWKKLKIEKENFSFSCLRTGDWKLGNDWLKIGFEYIRMKSDEKNWGCPV